MSAHRRLAAVAIAAALPLTACGADAPSGEVVGGAAAPDEVVTDELTVAALQLAFPPEGVWREGDDVPLYAAITNTGERAARLVDVEGDAFGEAVLTAADGSEGAIEIAERDNAYLEPEGPPSVLLTDLEESLRSSQSLEVTFVFADGAEVTMEAPVAPSSPADGGFDAPEDPTPADS